MNVSHEADKLYDIYELWHVPFWQTAVFWVILTFFTIVVLVVMLWRVIIKYKRRKIIETPWERALRELSCLKIQDAPTKEQGKQFYFALTSIVKNYLNERYLIKIVGKTDQELIPFIEQGLVPVEIVPWVRMIFTGSLEIKYANEVALKEQLHRDHDGAMLLVKRTSMPDKRTSNDN